MTLKKNALDPAEREKECAHELGFSYTGTIPCTGPKVCYMCGTRQDDNDVDKGTDRRRLD